jgi:hypothetical protein
LVLITPRNIKVKKQEKNTVTLKNMSKNTASKTTIFNISAIPIIAELLKYSLLNLSYAIYMQNANCHAVSQ